MVLTQHPADIEHTANKPAKNSCHDLAFTLLQESISVQFDQVDTLDAKASAAQVSASTLIGAALVFQAVRRKQYPGASYLPGGYLIPFVSSICGCHVLLEQGL